MWHFFFFLIILNLNLYKYILLAKISNYFFQKKRLVII